MYEHDTTKLFYLSFLLICPIVMLLIKEIGLLVAVIALIVLIASGVFAIIKFIIDYNCIWSKNYLIAPIFFRRSTLHSYIFENRETIIENSGSPRKFKKFADEEIRKFFKNEIRTIEKRIEVINKVEENDEDLMNDFISIVTSFCGRIYGRKRKEKTKKIIEEINGRKD